MITLIIICTAIAMAYVIGYGIGRHVGRKQGYDYGKFEHDPEDYNRGQKDMLTVIIRKISKSQYYTSLSILSFLRDMMKELK